MTADLVSLRLPLAERQYQSYGGRMNSERHGLPYVIQPCSSSLYNSGNITVSATQSAVAESTDTITSSAQTLSDTNASLNPVGVVYNGGTFKYQIRRPVESWKFVESHTSSGSVLYLCRVCNSSYKHKKSLNKHWKDKHSDLPRPEGAIPDEDDDDCEAEDEDSDFEPDPPHLLPAHIDQYSGDHSGDENRPPRDQVVPNYPQQKRAVGYSVPSATVTESPVSPLLPTRRFSTPHYKAHKPLLSSRYSSIQQKHSFNNTVASNDQPQKKRLKFLDSPPGINTRRQPGTPNAVEKKRYTFPAAKDSTPELSMNRRESVERNSRHHSKSTEEAGKHRSSVDNVTTTPNDGKPREDDGYLNGTSIPRGVHSVQTSTVTRHNYVSTTRGQESSREGSCEFQPLDLSVQRTIASTIDNGQTALYSNNVNQYRDSIESVKSVNKFLLIELLQTAINTLRNESKKSSQIFPHHQTMLTDYQHCLSASQILSRKSVTLLVAIGNLLIALMDGQSTSDEESQVLSSSVHSGPGTTGTRSVSRILPPAPSVAIGGPIEEQLSSKLLNTNMPNLSSIVVAPTMSGNHQISDEHRGDNNNPPVGGVRQQTSTLPTVLSDSFHDKAANFPASTIGIRQYSNLHCVTPITPSVPHQTMTCSPTVSLVNRTDHFHNQQQQYMVVTPPPPPPPLRTPEAHETNVIVCPVCQFEARWFSELRAHMVNHSDHRMFGCCYCTYRAKWKWDVAKHMRRCPLGRHIAHLTNEALLRMIRYYPPPTGSILYNYFPQDEFPGVGIDHPPTPPNYESTEGQIKSPQAGKHRSSDHISRLSEASLVSPTMTEAERMDRSHIVYSTPKGYEDVEAISPASSPAGLVIVEDETALDDKHTDENTQGFAVGRVGLDNIYVNNAVGRQEDSASRRPVLGEISNNTGTITSLQPLSRSEALHDDSSGHKIAK